MVVRRRFPAFATGSVLGGILVVAAGACGGDSQPSGPSSQGSSGASGVGGSAGGKAGAGGAGGATSGVGGGATGGKAGASTSGGNGGNGGSPAGAAGRGGTGGDEAGAGGTAGTGAESGSGGDGGTAALGQAGGGGGAGYTECGSDCEGRGFFCCSDRCVNRLNDPNNCGSCGNACPRPTPVCNSGTCVALECDPPDICPMLAAPIPPVCCGAECCLPGALCCMVPGPRGVTTGCVDPSESEGTCPRGCLDCDCAAPTTLVATPRGERPIADLAVGDLVYSVEGPAVVVVPVLAVKKKPVTWEHAVSRVTLANGAILEISGRHPTADGRLFSDLRAGDELGGVAVKSVTPPVPYAHAFTHDILPASSTGHYFVAGALIGSTLSR